MNSTPRVFNCLHVFLRRRMLPHLSVHGRCEQNRRARRERDRGERMTREPVREFGDDMRRRRRDEQKIGAICQFDVAGTPVLLFIIETCRDRIFGKRLQRQRRDEFGRIVRHHDKNIVSLFHEQAR